MATVTSLNNTIKAWLQALVILLFITQSTAYRFSKKGDAKASWELSAEKYHYGSDSWNSQLASLPNDLAAGKRSTLGGLNQLREISVEEGLAEASRKNEAVLLEVEYGLRELMTKIGEVRQPGAPNTPESPDSPNSPESPPPPRQPSTPEYSGVPNVPGRPRSPDAPTMPRTPNAPTPPSTPEPEPPVVPVETPVPPKSDASIILIEKSTRMAVEGLISELTVDVGRPTRGFVFQMPPKPCADTTNNADASFPNGELRIPEDAASFVIPSPGIQKVKLSHPLLCSTDEPLVLVMEHVETERSRFQSMHGDLEVTCPLRVVRDSSTTDLIQRAYIPSNMDKESEPIKAQIFGGKFDEESGAYKILTHRFSQPHTLVMHFLIKLGQLDALSLGRSSKSIIHSHDGYKLILPLSDRVDASAETSNVPVAVNNPPQRYDAFRRFGRY